MVKDLETDVTKGSDGGVDDHTIKLPLATTPTLCAKVASCCAHESDECCDHIHKMTIADDKKYKAHLNGNEAESIPKEHETPKHSPCNKGTVAIRE